MMTGNVLPPADASADKMKPVGVFFPKRRDAYLHGDEEKGRNPGNENGDEEGEHGLCSRVAPCSDG